MTRWPALAAGADTSPKRSLFGDALIAAVAEDLDAVVVTRNRPDFERQGIEVLTY